MTIMLSCSMSSKLSAETGLTGATASADDIETSKGEHLHTKRTCCSRLLAEQRGNRGLITAVVAVTVLPFFANDLWVH